jgi:hypothetical protein
VSQEPSEQDLIEAYRRTVKPLYAYVSRRVGGDVSLAEARINVGTANPLNLAEAELRVQELQLKMSKVGYELLLIRSQLGK